MALLIDSLCFSSYSLSTSVHASRSAYSVLSVVSRSIISLKPVNSSTCGKGLWVAGEASCEGPCGGGRVAEAEGDAQWSTARSRISRISPGRVCSPHPFIPLQLILIFASLPMVHDLSLPPETLHLVILQSISPVRLLLLPSFPFSYAPRPTFFNPSSKYPLTVPGTSNLIPSSSTKRYQYAKLFTTPLRISLHALSHPILSYRFFSNSLQRVAIARQLRE
ncbi:hypothetical protein PSPO01_06450 [Paraphaeosphaeria sporulosa]